MVEDNDGLIKAQNEVIGILFEVIKKLQKNIDLQEEGVRLIIESKDSDLDPVSYTHLTLPTKA